MENKRKIVAYNSKGKSLTVKEYIEEIERSIQEYKSGFVISQREMETKPKK